MPTIEVDGNIFDFDDTCRVEVYDQWSFYTDRIQKSLPAGFVKACDVVVIDTGTLYLIEAKDYTQPAGTTMPPIRELASAVSAKAFHTLGGLHAGARFSDFEHQDFCRAALACTRVVVCLAMEPPGSANSWLWAQQPLTSMADALRRQVKFISGHPLVIANRSAHGAVPWTSRPAGNP